MTDAYIHSGRALLIAAEQAVDRFHDAKRDHTHRQPPSVLLARSARSSRCGRWRMNLWRTVSRTQDDRDANTGTALDMFRSPPAALQTTLFVIEVIVILVILIALAVLFVLFFLFDLSFIVIFVLLACLVGFIISVSRRPGIWLARHRH